MEEKTTADTTTFKISYDNYYQKWDVSNEIILKKNTAKVYKYEPLQWNYYKIVGKKAKSEILKAWSNLWTKNMQYNFRVYAACSLLCLQWE